MRDRQAEPRIDRLLTVSTAPADMSARPSHRGGSTTLRSGADCQAAAWGPAPIRAATNVLDFSLSVNDWTIRNWMPAKNKSRPASKRCWRVSVVGAMVPLSSNRATPPDDRSLL